MDNLESFNTDRIYLPLKRRPVKLQDRVNVQVLDVKLSNDGLKIDITPLTGWESEEMYIFPQTRVLKRDLLKPLHKSFGSLKRLSFKMMCFERDIEIAKEIAVDALREQLKNMQGDIGFLEEMLKTT